MNRWAGWLAVMIALTVSGCQGKKADVYSVVFEGAPALIDSQVYYLGEDIGDIVEHQSTVGKIVRLAIRLTPESRKLMKTNTVFVVDSGRLVLTFISSYGDPIGTETPVLGLSSGLALTWFKAKNALGQPAAAAGRSAAALFSKFQAAEQAGRGQ